MMSAILKKSVWVFLTGMVLVLAGCGGNKATVTGRVTLGGRIVDSGFVTFFPEDNRGSAITTEIVQGEYRMEDLVPGKKRIYVSITNQDAAADTPSAPSSRKESNAERLGEMKKRRTGTKQPPPVQIGGNNAIHDVSAGSQQIDIPLEKLGPGEKPGPGK